MGRRRPISSRSQDLKNWHREDIIKTKRKIKLCFENFDFRNSFDQNKKHFLEKIPRIHEIRKIENLEILSIFEIFRKTIFCFGRKFFEKIKIFKIKFYFSFCFYYVLAVSNFQVRGPVRNRSAVSPKKAPFPKFPFWRGQIRLTSGSCPKRLVWWKFWE